MMITPLDPKSPILQPLAPLPGKRIQRSREERDAILDAFESSGLSAPDFAAYHHLNYQTFAAWRRRRRHEAAQTESAEFTFVEMTHSQQSEPPQAGVSISLAGGAQAVFDSEDQVPLVAALIKALV